jgi:hypothetical protein
VVGYADDLDLLIQARIDDRLVVRCFSRKGSGFVVAFQVREWVHLKSALKKARTIRNC